jgi:uncharacterized membrane protein YphA (DoxX/SURF4 family)
MCHVENNMTQSRRRTVSVVAAFLGVVMIAGGAMKIVGAESQVAAFAAMGLPPWFRALTGTFEVLGGILLAVPVTTPVGSLVLSTIMVGALWAHVAQGEWLKLVPGGVLLTLFLLMFRWNQSRVARLLGGG